MIASILGWETYNGLCNDLRSSISDKALGNLQLEDILQIKFVDCEQDDILMTNTVDYITGVELVDNNVNLTIKDTNGNSTPLDLADYRIDIVDLLNVLETLEHYEYSTL